MAVLDEDVASVPLKPTSSIECIGVDIAAGVLVN